ncbi:MAG: dTDP-4-dehydrorhamnose 3,5-epimerase family protein [Nitrospirae bacterium]|nr:dTDP-4-dehydrorhamnose 3,5-epimerase family protein [Nitrospirota bacterium]MCL5422759.1 dTDP-4-dehydrorhamnose 3,5-epimerase family protein [Nitrospirota bacterium]
MFTEGEIAGVLIRKFSEFHDQRGWLSELYRIDETGEYRAAMTYLSVTNPGLTRGPHEHIDQTDYFCFMGTFTLYLWDNRKGSSTYGKKMVIENADRMIAVVPPGVVHAYKNSGETEGIVLNFPDRLYAGWGKKEKVDEVRYESDPQSPFKI